MHRQASDPARRPVSAALRHRSPGAGPAPGRSCGTGGRCRRRMPWRRRAGGGRRPQRCARPWAAPVPTRCAGVAASSRPPPHAPPRCRARPAFSPRTGGPPSSGPARSAPRRHLRAARRSITVASTRWRTRSGLGAGAGSIRSPRPDARRHGHGASGPGAAPLAPMPAVRRASCGRAQCAASARSRLSISSGRPFSSGVQPSAASARLLEKTWLRKSAGPSGPQ